MKGTVQVPARPPNQLQGVGLERSKQDAGARKKIMVGCNDRGRINRTWTVCLKAKKMDATGV